MPYQWTNKETIQKYLDLDGTIVIGEEGGEEKGNFSEDTSEIFENDSVYEIETMLSAAWEIPLPTDNTDLSRIAAKLTASKIGTSRVGSSIGKIPDWTDRYKNEVFSQIIRMLVNNNTVNISEATKREDVSIADILILAKVREQTVSRD